MRNQQAGTVGRRIDGSRNLVQVQRGRPTRTPHRLAIKAGDEFIAYLSCIVTRENILACALESTRSSCSLPEMKQAWQMVVSSLNHGTRLIALPKACIDPRPSPNTNTCSWSYHVPSATYTEKAIKGNIHLGWCANSEHTLRFIISQNKALTNLASVEDLILATLDGIVYRR